MPILMSLSQSSQAPAPASPACPCRLDLRALDGSELIHADGQIWVNRAAVTGIDLAPREIVADRIAGMDGSRLVQINTLDRDVVIPFLVRPQTRTCHEVRAQVSRLRRVLDYRRVDYAANDGHLDIVGTSGDGFSRSLRVAYVEGAEGFYADRGPGWAVFALRFLAVDPYWRGGEWTTPLVGVDTTPPFLSTSGAHAWPRMLAPSVVIGADMPVDVQGDVPSAPVLDIVGPATSTTVTSPSGMSVTIGAIGAGESFRLDTRRRVSVALNGSEAWGLLGASPRWAPLAPGATTISVVATGATAATRVRVWGDSLWESPW